MALIGSDFSFHLSVATGYQDKQPDPLSSIGGYLSESRVETREGAVTTQVSDAYFRDTSLIDTSPASPDYRTPLVNSGSYSSAANLVHWYRFSVDDTAMGTDYATAGTPIDLTQSSGLDASDVVALQPGQFDQQRDSVVFTNPNNDTIKKIASANYGIANSWSVGIWLRSTSAAAAIMRCFRMGGNINAEDVNEITMYRNGGFFYVTISDGTTAADRKAHVYNAPALNTWVHIMITWDGTTLKFYRDGSFESPVFVIENDSVTQNTNNRYCIISGLRVGWADAQEEWEGQLHSVCVWNTALGSGEIADLVDFGDGLGEGVLDLTEGWIVFLTGANLYEARQVIFHDKTTGDIGVSPPFSNAPAVGEIHRVAKPLNLFDDVSAEDCSAGYTDYRMVYLYNQTSVSLNDIRIYLIPLNSAGTNMEVAMGNGSKGSNQVTPIADDETAPDLDTTGTTGFTSTFVQRFRPCRDYDSAEEVPYPVVNAVNNGAYPIWIRRTLEPQTKHMDKAAWLLVAEETGGVKTAVPIVFDLVGFTPLLSAGFDRTPRTFGGARIEIEVTDQDADFPIEGQELYAVIDTGPGTLITDSQPFETDEDGEAYAIYISPEDDAQAGATVTLEVKMGGDP